MAMSTMLGQAAITPLTPREVLRDWMVTQGFEPMQDVTSWDGPGYFITSTSRCKSWQVFDEYRRAVVMYRGGGLLVIRKKLREVADVLDALGVGWDAEENSRGYPMLIAEVAELWEALQTKPTEPTEPTEPKRPHGRRRRASAEAVSETAD